MLSLKTMYGIPIASTLAAGALGLMLVGCDAQAQRAEPRQIPTGSEIRAADLAQNEGFEIDGDIVMQRFASTDGTVVCEFGDESVMCMSPRYSTAVMCYPTECYELWTNPADNVGDYKPMPRGSRIVAGAGFTCIITQRDTVVCVGERNQVTYAAGLVTIF